MENFSKIKNLFRELNDELSTLKTDLENDMNYSVSHAEIVTNVEVIEESLQEVERQMRDVERDVDVLNETLEARSINDDDEDDDREVKMYSRVGDDDDD